MRKAMWLGVLALAACNENAGWNPNYVIADRPYGAVFDSTTPYAAYKYEREWALLGERDVPKTIPVALPVKAPTPLEIRGRDEMQVIRGQAVIVVNGPELPEAWRQGAAPAAAVVVAVPAQPVAAPAVPVVVPASARAAVVTAPAAKVATAPVTYASDPRAPAVLTRFAAATNHERGTAVWPRPNADPRIAARTCRSYADAESAQIAFIARGGPEADPAQMDPDGDGFVCGWDPGPWRQAQP